MRNDEHDNLLRSAARTLAQTHPRQRGVLVVESDPDLQWKLARMLTVDGNRVVGAGTADGALALVDQWQADLALVASELPGTTGIEVARKLRVRNPELLVILMGEDEVEVHPTPRSTHVTAYLPKPFPFDALRALIASLQLAPAPAE